MRFPQTLGHKLGPARFAECLPPAVVTKSPWRGLQAGLCERPASWAAVGTPDRAVWALATLQEGALQRHGSAGGPTCKQLLRVLVGVEVSRTLGPSPLSLPPLWDGENKGLSGAL